MKTHSETASENFKKGYNCAQAVFAAYAKDLGINVETALKLSSSFGGGMGRLREVCGAVSGIFMAAGLLYGYSSCNDKEEKTAHYERIQHLAHKFQQIHGSIICRELLKLDQKEDNPVPSDRTKEYYKKRPCEDFVKDACKILDEYIQSKSSNFK